MSAPKNRKSRMQRRGAAPTAVVAAPFELTQEEKRLVMLYRATHDYRQHMVIVSAEIYVKHFPRHTRPALRLVDGGAA